MHMAETGNEMKSIHPHSAGESSSVNYARREGDALGFPDEVIYSHGLIQACSPYRPQAGRDRRQGRRTAWCSQSDTAIIPTLAQPECSLQRESNWMTFNGKA